MVWVSGLVALERLDHQREPGRVGEQTEGDLRLQPTFLGEPRLPEPVAGVGLEVQGGHVVEHQRRRPERCPRRARGRQTTTPCLLGVDRQAPLDGAIGGRRDAGLLEDPHAVFLATSGEGDESLEDRSDSATLVEQALDELPEVPDEAGASPHVNAPQE
jgi:hypothetical protein